MGKAVTQRARGPAAPAARSSATRQSDRDPDVDAAQEALAGLWAEYKLSGSPLARDKLILQYSPLVKYVAGRVSTGLPANIEQADLVSYGIFGLIDAIEKFEPGRGNKFETYAISRIRGSIIDELRAIDWVPRSVRYKAREIEKAIARLRASSPASPPTPRSPSRWASASTTCAGCTSQSSSSPSLP